MLENRIVVETVHGDCSSARDLEYEVFLDAKYIPANSTRRVLEYDAYENSVFLIARKQDKPVGIVRLIRLSDAEVDYRSLPTVKNFKIEPNHIARLSSIKPQKLIEIGTIAVDPMHRKSDVSAALIKQIMRYSWKNGIWYALSSIDEGYYKALVRKKLPFTQIGEAEPYMGSVTVPTFFDSHKVSMQYLPLLYCYKITDMLK